MATDRVGSSGPVRPSGSPFSSLAQGFLLAARSWSAALNPHAPAPSTQHASCLASPLVNATAAAGPASPECASPSCLAQSLGGGGALDPLVFRLLSHMGVEMSPPSSITHAWPWVHSPTPLVLALALYLAAVLLWTRYIRWRGLEPRSSDPFPLKALVLLHNLFLCGLSFYMGSGLVLEAYRSGFSVWGNRCMDNNPRMAFYIYLFYTSKIYEFVDTAIMLLKRNLRQVSYLHVYHHASISFIWWILCYRCPVGDTYYSAAFNSWIHVIMYSYYLLAAAIGKDERRRRKYLFWGKYLTMLQMAQFVSFIGQSIFFLAKNWLEPGFSPAGIPRLLFFYSLSLLLFFMDFFVKKHLGENKRKNKEAVQKRD